MGGQACVLYGAAQFSKDIDFVLLANDDNRQRLELALSELQAERIAVPRLSLEVLERGHAVHFRCQALGVEGLRVDVMARLRGLPDFETLWNRRTTLEDPSGITYEVLSVADLVTAKKTQREKDWPMITALVESHYHNERNAPTREKISFWLRECRIAERLVELARQFPVETSEEQENRPLLMLAPSGTLEDLRTALDAEVRSEQSRDREYWDPLKRELEQIRFEEKRRRDN
ncbi:MAG: hypothetical protein U0936_07795 [Planctomycetaceae bacterium]